MKVADLIKQLQQFPPDMQIVSGADEDGDRHGWVAVMQINVVETHDEQFQQTHATSGFIKALAVE